MIELKRKEDCCGCGACAEICPKKCIALREDEEGFLSGAGLSGSDAMELTVAGNDDRILLLARYDNLGKGASGAAIQCLNLSLGCDITEGLVL